MPDAPIFIGGPGRSGTSFVSDRVGAHPQVVTFRDVELKIFFEYGGLYDLRAILTEDYSPNRATVGARNFDRIVDQLLTGGYGQPVLGGDETRGRLEAAFGRFRQAVRPGGFAMPLGKAEFNAAARALLADLTAVALEHKPGARRFLEKTPHNLLQPLFLHELAPRAQYIHVIRDPRAIAVSLLGQSWGPASLEQAIRWVQAYFTSWEKSAALFARFGLPLLELRIEETSAQTGDYSMQVQDFLELEDGGDIFQGASPGILDGWRGKADAVAHEMLEAEMAALCARLGYA